jgi:hypothetical protein
MRRYASRSRGRIYGHAFKLISAAELERPARDGELVGVGHAGSQRLVPAVLGLNGPSVCPI